MAGFVMRKNQRFKELVPVQYRGEGIAGEGMLKDLSLKGDLLREPSQCGPGWCWDCTCVFQETRSLC